MTATNLIINIICIYGLSLLVLDLDASTTSEINGNIGDSIVMRFRLEFKSIQESALILDEFASGGGAGRLVITAHSGINDLLIVPLAPAPYNITVIQEDITSTDPPVKPVEVLIYIPELTREHEGRYSCQMEGQTQSRQLWVNGPPYGIELRALSGNAVLTYLGISDPSILPSSQAVWKAEVDIDKQIMLEIETIPSSRPEAEVTWSAADGSFSVNQKIISLTTDDLRSKYICTARNSYGSYEVTLVVEKQYKPRSPVISSADVFPEEGKSLQTRCEFDASPPASIFYVKEDIITKSWQRINSDIEDTLYISAIDLDEDIGTYKCIGSNIHGNSSGIIKVHGRPREVNLTIGDIYGDGADLLFRTYSAIPVTFTLVIESNLTLSNSMMTEEAISETITRTIDERGPQVVPHIQQFYPLKELSPRTRYKLTLVASNKHGNVSSHSTFLSTGDEYVTRSQIIFTTTETKEITTVNTTPEMKADNLLILLFISTSLLAVL